MFFQGKCKGFDRMFVGDPLLEDRNPYGYIFDGFRTVGWRVEGVVRDFLDTKGSQQGVGKQFAVALFSPEAPVKVEPSGWLEFSAVGDMVCREFDVVTTSGLLGIGVADGRGEMLDEDGEDLDVCCLNLIDSGMVGKVLEFTGEENNDVRVLVISGFVRAAAGCSQEKILDYLVEALGLDLEMSFSLDETVINAMVKSIQEKKEREKNKEDWMFGMFGL